MARSHVFPNYLKSTGPKRKGTRVFFLSADATTDTELVGCDATTDTELAEIIDRGYIIVREKLHLL